MNFAKSADLTESGLPEAMYRKLVSDIFEQPASIKRDFIEVLYSKQVSDDPGDYVPIRDEQGRTSLLIQKHVMQPSESASGSGIQPALA